MDTALSKARSVADVLGQAGLDPLERRVLLCAASGLSREDLARQPELMLENATLARYDRFAARRLAGEPIAYLTGYREFYGRDFATDARALIPRPETELLIDLALLRCPAKGERTHVLDIGCGTGCVAITLKLEKPLCEVVAIDISEDALALARNNAARLGAEIAFAQWDLALPYPGAFDLIVSNPPYVAADDPHLHQGDLRFEPPVALIGGKSGLELIDALIRAAAPALTDEGWLLIEHGHDQAGEVAMRLDAARLGDIASWPDLAGHLRVTGARRPRAIAKPV